MKNKTLIFIILFLQFNIFSIINCSDLDEIPLPTKEEEEEIDIKKDPQIKTSAGEQSITKNNNLGFHILKDITKLSAKLPSTYLQATYSIPMFLDINYLFNREDTTDNDILLIKKKHEKIQSIK